MLQDGKFTDIKQKKVAITGAPKIQVYWGVKIGRILGAPVIECQPSSGSLIECSEYSDVGLAYDEVERLESHILIAACERYGCHKKIQGIHLTAGQQPHEMQESHMQKESSKVICGVVWQVSSEKYGCHMKYKGAI